MISEFFKSRSGVILISIIWALGLSTLFRKSCESGSNCQVITFRGPSNKEASGVWNYGTKPCYKLNPYVVDCKTRKTGSKDQGQG